MRNRAALPSKASHQAESLVQTARFRVQSAQFNKDDWIRLTDNRRRDYLDWSPDECVPAESRAKSDVWFRERIAEGEALVDQYRAEWERLAPLLTAAEKAEKDYSGLAPWDREAIALRLTLDGVANPVVPSDMMRGGEVIDCFKGALDVSRSSYFQLFRPLLRTYTLTPWRFETYGRHTYRVPGSHTRFERAEVEALIVAIGKRELWY